MRRPLPPHPDSRPGAVFRIEAEAVRPRPGALALTYVVSGDVGALRWPAAGAPARMDGLWRTTCFEAFLKDGQEAGYREFNFAPSAHWAAYRFDSYRQGMRELEGVAAPRIETNLTSDRYEMHVALTGVPDVALRLGLSAVIEEEGGAISYWALAHGPGKPDFHHAAAFALTLPAMESS